MISKQKEQNQDILEQSISHLQFKGFENIKADIPGYDTPKTFKSKRSGVEVTPDISATKNGKKYFFDISLKSTKVDLLKSKWLLLDTFSRLKTNRFKIITTRGHLKFTRDLLNDIQLSQKEFIKI
ncbi:hypothetical protein MTsPCn5_01800 [Croceitalea sp. MTPC5]|uniref:hypothetical protein n=1 Tax=Croceitalea sp. MTPC5 TaxID=3056565 RepID=UPI002B382200|nr:hypothetical protein MTsPCn5_01800 [Croceitalea sp. MTPC5]